MKANRLVGLLLALALALPGCGAVRSLNAAAEAQDTYELQPLSGGIAGRTGRSLSVEVPSAAAAIATERILIKPNALQVAYLPGSRWVEAAPLHVQSLLIRSVANSGRAGFVGGPVGTGPLQLTARPAVADHIHAHPEWIAALQSRSGRPVAVAADAQIKGAGHAQ